MRLYHTHRQLQDQLCQERLLDQHLLLQTAGYIIIKNKNTTLEFQHIWLKTEIFANGYISTLEFLLSECLFIHCFLNCWDSSHVNLTLMTQNIQYKNEFSKMVLYNSLNSSPSLIFTLQY